MSGVSSSQRDRELAAINRLRGTADRLAADRWLIEARGGVMRLIVRRSSGEDAHVATIHADALDDERDILCGGLDNLLLFLRLFDRAAVAVRDLRGELAALKNDQPVSQHNKPNHAAQASILLSKPAFQRFLTESGRAAVSDKDSADAALKARLGITSKKQINEDDRARSAWLSLHGEFEGWLRGGGEG